MHPDDEVLAALALGEPIPGEVTSHVAGCSACEDVLADLRRILRHVRGADTVQLSDPPDSVWTGIASLTTGPSGTGSQGPDTALGESGGTARGASSPLASTTGRVDELAERRARAPRRPGARWLIAATAAGVALGVLGVQLAGALRAPAPTPVVATAQLDTLTDARRGGDAKLVEEPGGLTLQVNVEPLDAKDGYLEVWLINTDLSRMVSVGVLPGKDTTASFLVASAMLDQGYKIVDISREQFDDRPQHSGDSLLRGTLN